VLGMMMLVSEAAPAADTPTTAPTTRPWRQVVQDALGAGTYDKKDEVYTITRPRSDLLVTQLDMGDIPAGAGLASTICFFPCPCGKTNVVGQLCVVDYEISSVVDELRAGKIDVVSISPMLLGEKPRMFMIRLQGRSDAQTLASAIQKALEWMVKRTK
jgi:hypothetical protein